MNSSLQDGPEKAMSIRIGYLLPTRERIMAGQPQAAPFLKLAERAERVSVPLRCPSWRASPSARRRAAAAKSRLAGAAACRHRPPKDRGKDHAESGLERRGVRLAAEPTRSPHRSRDHGFHR